MKSRHIVVVLFGIVGLGCMFLAVVFSGCGLPVVLVGKTVEPAVIKMMENQEHRKGPIPESEWNPIGIWYRISDTPPVYLPKGYGRDLPRNDRSGTWYVDKRDGKRLFVPHGGVDGIPEAALAVEARNSTRWKTYDKMKVDKSSLISGEMRHGAMGTWMENKSGPR